MTNADKNKDERQSRKAAQKQLLRLAINNYGEEGILFAKESQDGRHPFTQEVMLLADERGLKQSEIAELTGVSQPTVSGWENGEGRATIDSISPLIKMLSSVGPGNSFYSIEVTHGAQLELSDNWEVEMLHWFLMREKRHHYNLSVKSLTAVLWEEYVKQLDEEIRLARKQANAETSKLTRHIDRLKSLIAKAEQEERANLAASEKYTQEKLQLLQNNPEFNALKPEKLEILVQSEIGTLSQSHIYQPEMEEYLAVLEAEYADFNREDAVAFTEALLKTMQATVNAKLTEMESQKEEQLKAKSPLQQYNPDAITKPLTRDGVRFISEEKLSDYCESLFDEGRRYQFRLQIVENRGYWEESTKNIEIDVLCRDVFKAYLTEAATFRYSLESIMLCGEHWFSNHESTLEHYTCNLPGYEELNDYYELDAAPNTRSAWCIDGADDNYGDSVDVFKMFSGKLALVHGCYDHNSNKRIYSLHPFSLADELLNYVTSFLPENEINDWKKRMMERGYLVESARLVY